MNNETCVICGAVIPEGFQVCPRCEKMNNETCAICGANVPVGAQICGRCEEVFAGNREIIKAMFDKRPVEYEGIKYGCISGVTIRTRVSHLHALPVPYVVQAELMSARAHCVVVADPKKVKIL